MIARPLTPSTEAAILYPLSQKTKAGIETPREAAIGHLNQWFFCTHQKHRRHCVVCILLWWGVLSSPLKGWPDLAGSLNLIHSTAQRLRPMGGGLTFLQGAPL